MSFPGHAHFVVCFSGSSKGCFRNVPESNQEKQMSEQGNVLGKGTFSFYFKKLWTYLKLSIIYDENADVLKHVFD